MLLALLLAATQEPISFASLVQELEDMEALTRFPEPAYQALRATSFQREETNSGRHEWVIQEQQGPGCLTRFWAPYFYRDLADHVGPRVRVYLDGASEPMLDLPLIELVTQNEWRANYGPKPPRQGKLDVVYTFGGFTARAGNFYMPIAFAKGSKVTLDKPPFDYSVDSRAYPAGTAVKTTSYANLKAEIDRRVESGCAPPRDEPGESVFVGERVVTSLDVEIDPKEVAAHPELLRQLVLRASFDGEECIWCPLGDFFGGPHALQGFLMRARRSDSTGKLHCAWRMPFREKAQVELLNLGALASSAKLSVSTLPRAWDARSMHFHASWRPDELVAGDRAADWNFVEIAGEGVFVGDQWTVLNPSEQVGTGTEAYYGWAGGVVPTRADVFSQPFLANICVGSTEHDSPRGFNVLARDRALDAIPFRERFVFELPASPGMGYSAVTSWYAKPGAKSNRGADPEAAKKPLMSLEALETRSREVEKLAKQPR